MQLGRNIIYGAPWKWLDIGDMTFDLFMFVLFGQENTCVVLCFCELKKVGIIDLDFHLCCPGYTV